MFKKLEEYLFYFFLFAIPISIRHIFGYEAFNFIEWQAIFIYGTDVLLLALFGFWLQSGGRPKVGRSEWFLLAFVTVAAISIKNALNVDVAIFRWVKLCEMLVLYFYIKDYATKRFNLSCSFAALVIGGVFQSVVAILQFMVQHSLGLKYLGESVFTSSMTSIAAFYVDGVKIIRAYGTTPHANVLAVYLFVALGAFYFIGIYNKRQWVWHLSHILILWAFFLTFSRTILALWGLTFLVRTCLIRFYPRFKKEFWNKPEMRSRGLKIFITTVTVALVFITIYWPYVKNRILISGNDEAIQLRLLYNQESLHASFNWFGHGMGNFVPWLMHENLHLNPILYQPVHNIYLLVYTENGILGISFFALFLVTLLYNFWRQSKFNRLYHFSFMLIVGSMLIWAGFDHFFWTIQTGQLVFWLGLGLLAGTDF